VLINNLPAALACSTFFRVGLFIWIVLDAMVWPGLSFSDESISCTPHPPYEAPQYVEPVLEPEISNLHLIDNKDGTITDLDSGLLWTKKDSYADFGKCLTWQESVDYVEKLNTASFTDWRMPTIKELVTLYDPTKENNMAWDHSSEYPLALDEKFASGSAYWFWSSDGQIMGSRGCAKTFYFVNGLIHFRNLDQCNNGGVRAVRNLK